MPDMDFTGLFVAAAVAMPLAFFGAIAVVLSWCGFTVLSMTVAALALIAAALSAALMRRLLG